MNHDVLFTPYVTVEVTPEGEIVGVTLNWSDTLRNDYQDGLEVWTEGDDIVPPTTFAASAYVDDPALRDRVLAALQPTNPIVERLKADLAYHQEEAERITREVLDIDTAEDEAYTIEADTEESYHSGRAAAMQDAIDLLEGREVKLYSETESVS